MNAFLTSLLAQLLGLVSFALFFLGGLSAFAFIGGGIAAIFGLVEADKIPYQIHPALYVPLCGVAAAVLMGASHLCDRFVRRLQRTV